MSQTLEYYKQVLKFRTLPSLEGITDPSDDKALKWVQYKVATEITEDPSKLEEQEQIEEIYINQMKQLLTKDTYEEPYKPSLDVEPEVEEVLPAKEYEPEVEPYKPPLSYVEGSTTRQVLQVPEEILSEPAPTKKEKPYSDEKGGNKFWAFVIFVGIMCLVD